MMLLTSYEELAFARAPRPLSLFNFCSAIPRVDKGSSQGALTLHPMRAVNKKGGGCLPYPIVLVLSNPFFLVSNEFPLTASG
jgi:hypothetical protein